MIDQFANHTISPVAQARSPFACNRAAAIPSLEVLWGLDPKLGGIVACVPALSAAISSDDRYQSRVLAFVPAENGFQGLRRLNGNTFTFPSGRLRWLSRSCLQTEMNALAAESSVMHIHGLWQEHVVAATSAATKARIPYVVSAHGMLEPWALHAKRWKKEVYASLFERRYLGRASVLRALTRSEVDDYRRFGLKGPVVVVPNGVRIPVHPDPQLFLNVFPNLAGKRLILFLSRLHPKKRPDMLVSAWSRIAPRFPDAHLVLAGPDEINTRKALVQLVERFGLQNRITFTGLLAGDLKWSALAASEMFVLPSYSEGFSMAVLEALACSRPVILTKQCNFEDVSLHQAGLIIESEEIPLKNALVDILTLTSKDREAMGERGRELVRSKYSEAAVGRSMADVYDWLLGGSTPQSAEIYR